MAAVSPRRLSAQTEALAASPPIFRSPMLDRLTRVHPAVPVAIFLPAITTFAILGLDTEGAAEAVPMIFGGYLTWTLCEYWIHRAVFHFEPAAGLGARLHWMIHGVHHDHPHDRYRLVMPPVVSLSLGTAFFFTFVAIFGLTAAWSIAAGFFAGYLLYDMVHFALHHWRARGRLGQRLRELHMRHHFDDDRCGFAVSAPWWDLIFGTYSPKAGPARRG